MRDSFNTFDLWKLRFNNAEIEYGFFYTFGESKLDLGVYITSTGIRLGKESQSVTLSGHTGKSEFCYLQR